ncbi:hypothetical protein [Mesorhizobium sp. Root554]|uniref:hypothetical protein n=2 Tax=unclassified Mesorhizobium TaxID=325217 RepID=UPI000AC672C1|nr:hypothetical protein [Mesorhizobium sp. Root554]
MTYGGAWRVLPALAVAMAAPAAAQDFDPTALDLATLIECRANAPAYNGFALWFSGEPDAADKLGWRPVDAGNFLLQQYEMSAPVNVFGHTTETVAFTSTGLMAVLDGVSAPELATERGIVPLIATRDKFLGEKVLVDDSEIVDGITYATRISLNVSTVDSHPGKVLAGCSYAIEVK